VNPFCEHGDGLVPGTFAERRYSFYLRNKHTYLTCIPHYSFVLELSKNNYILSFLDLQNLYNDTKYFLINTVKSNEIIYTYGPL